MKNIVKIELINCINRKEYKLVLFTIMLISLGSFIVSCISFYGSDILFIRSAYEMAIVEGNYSENFLGLLVIILPILSTLIYSSSYYEDRITGRYNTIAMRIETGKYIWSKVFVIFIVTFLTFFIPLLLNQILCFIAFPLEGLDTNQGLPFYDIGIQNYSSEYLFNFMKIQYPLFYNIFKIFLISIFASLWGVFSYSIHFIDYMQRKGKYPILIFSFMAYILLDLILSFLGMYEYSHFNFLLPNGVGEEKVVLIWIISMAVINLVLLLMFGNKNRIKNKIG